MPVVEHLLTKQSAICLKKAVFLQKIHKLRRPKRARLSLFFEHSHLPFGRPIVVKPLSNEVLCGRGMLTYPIVYGGHFYPFVAICTHGLARPKGVFNSISPLTFGCLRGQTSLLYAPRAAQGRQHRGSSARH